MCYYFLMRGTHWWSNFLNRSINKDFIGYAVFWPFKVKRFDLGKNGCHFRNQRAKGYLHTDFERNHYSNLNANIFRLSDLDLDLWPWPWIFFKNVLLLLDETNTLMAEFFKLLQKWRFCRVRRFLKWPWPMTLTSDFFKCATTSRWDEHTGGRFF